MSKKVICESCGTIFKEEVVKDMDCCPVCGVSFDDDVEEDKIKDMQSEKDTGDYLMYFDEIVIYKDEPEYSHVSVYCGECEEDNSLELDQFDKLVDEKYVILKKGITITCEGCGKKHTARKILYKRKDHYAPPLPRCPVCDSIMLKKISKTSKFVAAATLGTLSLPYNSKTFECKDCGYRF